ncbi:methyltransferase, TIGR04325 family [Piscinibacter sp.]|uniref:methyltransferase, TIGR04325 family n=1 Tax=Piscinibacter sp. TaxID=1903157 RepID=UPI002F3ED1BE
MSLHSVAKSLCPPLLASSLKRLSGKGLRFDGSPDNWAEALRMSSGYSHADILAKVIEATREVVSGRAAYERDSVLFYEPAVPFQTVSTLLRSAVRDGGRLEVIDFGGSLGSTYRQCRPFLAGLQRLQWHVIEQASFVDAGRAEFSSAELHFHRSIDEVPAVATPFTFIFSSVLQYLEHPYDVIGRLHTIPGRHLMIDRSTLSNQQLDRLCIQHAPKNVYRASYPCWILSRDKLLALLSPHWQLLGDFQSPEALQRTADGLQFQFRGLIFERRL